MRVTTISSVFAKAFINAGIKAQIPPAAAPRTEIRRIINTGEVTSLNK